LYAANLHKNEQVLTAQEAQAYRNGGKSGNTYSFGNIIIQGGSTDKVTVERLMRAIAKEIDQTGGLMA
jgi:hypothetical protein